jgi:hypothetical protein
MTSQLNLRKDAATFDNFSGTKMQRGTLRYVVTGQSLQGSSPSHSKTNPGLRTAQ